MTEPYFFLSKNLKELKIIIENIILESNGCGIIYGDRKTGKTAFVKYIQTVNSKKRDFFYVDAQELDFKQIFELKNSVIIIDNTHYLTKDQIFSLKELCKENFLIFVVDKEYMVLLKEYLKDQNIKFSLEIKPISYRETEALFEQYIKSTQKPIQKNKEIIKYIYELTGGKLGEIFESLDKINDLVYYFTLKVSYKEKIKYLSIFLAIFVIVTALLSFLLFKLKNSSETSKTENTIPVIEKTKKKVEPQTNNILNKQTLTTPGTIPKQNIDTKNQPEYAIVIGRIVNLREKPSLDSKIIGKLKKLQIVNVLQEKDKWLKVKIDDQEGWVNKTYVKIVPQNLAVVKAHFLNLREKPSKDSKVLIKLKAGDIVKPTEEKKGKWIKVIYRSDKAQIEGWVSDQYIFEINPAQEGRKF